MTIIVRSGPQGAVFGWESCGLNLRQDICEANTMSLDYSEPLMLYELVQ